MKHNQSIFHAAAATILLLLPQALPAQTSASNEPVRPSADAWAMTKYGSVSPTLYTGTLHLSIPLYTYSDPDFEIPISAEYATNGCLPNDKAGSLGVGWTLSAGGSITREVRGVPDEKRLSRNISAAVTGDVYGFSTLHNGSLTRNDMHGMPVSGIGFSGRSCVYYRVAGSSGSYSYTFYDAEPDVFHFNFMGYSGTFQLDFNGRIQVYGTNVPPGTIKVEHNFATDSSNSAIAITTGDGYRYEFDGYYGNQHDNTEYTYDSGAGVIQTWKLSRIIAPNGRTVSFGYTRGASVRTLRPNTLCYNLGAYSPSYTDSQQYSNQKGISDGSVVTSDLTSIAVDGGTTIALSYDSTLEKTYLTSSESASQSTTLVGNDRLSTITVSHGGSTIRSCSFAYDSSNPGQRSFLTGVTVSGEGTYSMQYQNPSSIPMYCTFKVDHWGYFNGATGADFLNVSTLSADGMDETLNGLSVRNPDALSAKAGTLTRITYPTGGYSTFAYEGHAYGKRMSRPYSYDFWPQAATSSGSAGGVRIRRIQHYDSDGTCLDSREYGYVENGSSTGILAWIPRYKIQYTSINPAGVTEFGTMMSNSFSGNTATHIEYGSVTETRPDGSAIRHRYTTSLEREDILIYENGEPEKLFFLSPGGYPMLYDWSDDTAEISRIFMLTSRQSLRGRETGTEMLDSSGSVVSSTTNSYMNVLPDRDWIYTPQYLLHYTYDAGTFVGREDVGTRTESTSYGSQSVVRSTAFTYNSTAQQSSQTETGTRGERKVIRRTYVSDYADDPFYTIYRAMYYAGQLDRPVSEQVYSVASGSSSEALVSSRTYAYCRPDAANRPNLFCVESVTEHDGVTGRDYVTSYAYDRKGRILQRTDPSGRTTAYVWGYGGLYPVAEVVGATLAQVKSVGGLSGIETSALSGSLTSSQASSLRALGEATTWEYSPLVGVTSETGPDGRKVSYAYNSTGKLYQVLDDLGQRKSAYLNSIDNRQ